MVVRLVRSEAYEVAATVVPRLLAATGALAVVAAGASVLLTPLLLKAPLDQDSRLRASGAATFLDTTTGAPVQGTFVQDSRITTHKVNGIAAGSSTVASYDQVQTQSFASGGSTKELPSSTLTHAFDRSTGVGRPGAQGDTLGTTAHLFKLPFGTQKRDYTIWDVTAKRAVPLVYAGQKTIDGLSTYVFRRPVPATDLGILPIFLAVPGSWVGHPELPSIPAHEWYENADSTLYVEPVTGSLVGGASSPHVWAQTTGRLGGLKVDLLRVESAAPVAADAARLVAEAKSARAKVIRLHQAPWAFGGGALICFLAALVSRQVRRPRAVGREVFLPAPREPESEPASELTR